MPRGPRPQIVWAAGGAGGAAAPRATRDTAGLLPRTSRRSLAGVDAEFAIAGPACKPPSVRLRLGPELQQRQPEQQRQGLELPGPRRPRSEERRGGKEGVSTWRTRWVAVD